MNDPTDIAFNRRQFLIAGALLTVFGSNSLRINSGELLQKSDSLAVVPAWLAAVADTLIPRTKTPSATDVGADVFAWHVLTSVLATDISDRVLSGSRLLATKMRRVNPLNFSEWEHSQKSEFIKSHLLSGDDSDAAWFLRTLKKALLVGWVLTKPVITTAFDYLPNPGQYEATIRNSRIAIGSMLEKEYL